jgi:capsule polysaccharide export protein KpsE/RkpR
LRRPAAARPHLALLAALGLVGGCAVSADDCDPGRVRNVLTAVACEAGGRYAEREARLRAGVDARVAEHRLTAAETARIEGEAARLGADRAAREARLAAMGDDLAALEADLARARARTKGDEAALQALRAQGRKLRADLDRATASAARGGGGEGGRAAVEAEIGALTLEVERRQQAIRDILEGVAAY